MIENLWKAANPSGRLVQEQVRRSNPQAAKLAAAINSMRKGAPRSSGPEPAPGFEALVKTIFDPAGIIMKDPPGGYDGWGWAQALKPPSALG